MKHKLKKGQERLEVVDGPLAGRQFVPGREYTEAELKGMAPADLAKFEKIRAKAPAATSDKGGK